MVEREKTIKHESVVTAHEPGEHNPNAAKVRLVNEVIEEMEVAVVFVV